MSKSDNKEQNDGKPDYIKSIQYNILHMHNSKDYDIYDILQFVGDVMQPYVRLVGTVTKEYTEVVQKVDSEHHLQSDNLEKLVLHLEFKNDSVSALQALLLRELVVEQDDANKYHNEMIVPKVEAIQSNNVLNDPGLLMIQIGFLQQLLGRMSWQFNIAKIAMIYGNDPSLICALILLQLKRNELDIATLQSLPAQWIENNIPNSPAKKSTLCDGLTLAYEFEQSGSLQTAFSRDKDMNPRNLRTYINWLDAVKTASLVDLQKAD